MAEKYDVAALKASAIAEFDKLLAKIQAFRWSLFEALPDLALHEVLRFVYEETASKDRGM